MLSRYPRFGSDCHLHLHSIYVCDYLQVNRASCIIWCESSSRQLWKCENSHILCNLHMINTIIDENQAHLYTIFFDSEMSPPKKNTIKRNLFLPTLKPNFAFPLYRLLWGPPSLQTMGTGSFPGVKRPGRGVDHPPYLAPWLKKG